MRFSRSFLAILLLLFSGCLLRMNSGPDASAPRGGEDSEEAKIQSALQSLQGKKTGSYKIGPADLIEVTVYKEEDLNRKARVSPEGIITLPLVGQMRIGGLSVPQAEQMIAQRLKKFLRLPQVSIFIVEYGNKQIYVMGEVAKPGSYPIPTEAPLTVIEAISLAGGFTQYAAKDRTRVIRNENGKSTSQVVEVESIMRRGEKGKDIRLLPNDVVYVPERLF